MAAFESSYKSLLQGVSQQVPRERLPGQLTAQDNMLSDVVSNLRRRPGATYRFSASTSGHTANNVKAWYTDIAGFQVHVMLNSTTGAIGIFDTSFNPLAIFPEVPYVKADDAWHIRATTIGDDFFICNVGKKPVAVPGGLDTSKQGFFFIRTAAFSKTYSVTLSDSSGQWTYTYTTPDGTTAGDAALATPEYIIQQLVAAINSPGSHIAATASGATAGVISANPDLAITTTSGSNYMVTSGASNMQSVSDLPPTLPTSMDGYIMTTGHEKGKVYYRYDAASQTWLEDGAPGSATEIQNMPITLTYDDDLQAWTIDNQSGGIFEGRYAGDDDTNPDPEFLKRGITGMGSYQGRLVLLSGPMVSLSGSNRPRRFYRSTVADLRDDDCIHVGASANSSAAYEYCIPFQKDLLLFSSQYQALIPSGNQAITPRTATVVLTSTYDADTEAEPIPLGRTVMYPAPISEDFYGIMEMLPSNYTDSQYTSVNVTQHIPKYMGGRCRFGVSSSVVDMAMFGTTGDPRTLIIHEYSWDADEKVQQAWHRWTFEYDVAAAYFAGSSVVVLFVNQGHLIGCTLDPRAGSTMVNTDRRPFMDLYSFQDVTDHVVNLPAWLTTFDPAITDKLRLSQAQGDLSGEPVGFTVESPTELHTVLSYGDGRVALGVPFKSSVSPTPPLVKDANDVVVSSNKLTILRYLITTTGSAEYKVLVRDTHNTTPEAIEAGTLFWSSAELELGHARVGDDAVAVVPLRTRASSTTLSIYTEDLGELNIIGLEYICRYNQKLGRR